MKPAPPVMSTRFIRIPSVVRQRDTLTIGAVPHANYRPPREERFPAKIWTPADRARRSSAQAAQRETDPGLAPLARAADLGRCEVAVLLAVVAPVDRHTGDPGLR